MEGLARIGLIVGAVEVAMRGAMSIEGVLLEDGSPAPLDRATLYALLSHAGVYKLVMDALESAQRVVLQEGNDLGRSDIGSSIQSAAPDTAPIVN
jgi:metal-dependent HD superfamily phosphatase/phosphodiesterase